MSSLPKALNGDTLESTSDFLETNPDDAEIKRIIDEVIILRQILKNIRKYDIIMM